MKLEHIPRIAGTLRRLAPPVAALVVLAACVAPPVRTVAVPAPPPQRVFVYPARGQSPEQLERDRYECHVWAVQQTGVDPSRSDARAYERVVVQPQPAAGTVAGAIGGAIIGSIIAGPRDAGAGALIGGAAGAIVGSSADANAQAQAQQAQGQINRREASDRARSQSYRRAIGACLEGRGYSVS
jgi:hypothetical protein